MRTRINSQMQFSPDTTALFAVLFDFPLLLTEAFKAGGANNQMRNFTPGGRFKTDVNRLCPPADTGVIRTAKRNTHHGKNGINKALCGSQDQAEYTFNDQDGGDGEVRIVLRASPQCVYGGLIPGPNSLVIKPESDEAAVDEGLVVVAPVSDFKLQLCRMMCDLWPAMRDRWRCGDVSARKMSSFTQIVAQRIIRRY
jgi:hypothetical protein